MYLPVFYSYEKCRRECGGIQSFVQKASLYGKKLLVILCVFALLICDTAACLTSRLAGCLAFAAAAVLCALAEILCFKCLNTLHGFILLIKFIQAIITYNCRQVNYYLRNSFFCYIFPKSINRKVLANHLRGLLNLN